MIAIAILSIAFFANAFSNLGWVVWSDVIPRNFIGTMGGCLNICGNLSGIVSPIVIGVILQRTNNFHYAMWYIAAVALMGLLAYTFWSARLRCSFPRNRRNLYRRTPTRTSTTLRQNNEQKDPKLQSLLRLR